MLRRNDEIRRVIRTPEVIPDRQVEMLVDRAMDSYRTRQVHAELGQAYPPDVLEILIEGLLPAQRRWGRERQRVVSWRDPNQPAEKIDILQAPERLGGPTVVSAQTQDLYGRSSVSYAYTAVAAGEAWPEVRVNARTEAGGFGYDAPYYNVAPGIGLIVSKLLIQADPVEALRVETDQFINGRP